METIILTNEKECKNCRYFVQYYIKRSYGIKPISLGHCTKHANRKNLTLCKDWEDAALRKAGEKESIKKTLREMASKLRDIAFILKDDEE